MPDYKNEKILFSTIIYFFEYTLCMQTFIFFVFASCKNRLINPQFVQHHPTLQNCALNIIYITLLDNFSIYYGFWSKTKFSLYILERFHSSVICIINIIFSIKVCLFSKSMYFQIGYSILLVRAQQYLNLSHVLEQAFIWTKFPHASQVNSHLKSQLKTLSYLLIGSTQKANVM